MNILGKKLKEERKNLCMTHNEFSKKLGFSYVTLIKIEKGEYVGPKTIKALANYYNVSTRVIRKEMLTEYEDN